MSDYSKVGQTWKLPSSQVIVNDLRTAGGSPLKLVQAVADASDAESLIFAISEQLSKAENKSYLEQWEKLCYLGRKAAEQVGSDRLLQKYASGDIPKNATFLYRLVTDVRNSSQSLAADDDDDELMSAADQMLANLLSRADDFSEASPLSAEHVRLLERYVLHLKRNFQHEEAAEVSEFLAKNTKLVSA